MPGISNPEHSPEYWKPRMLRGPDDWPTPKETNDDDKILTAVFEALSTHSISTEPNPEYPHVYNFRLLIESDIPDAADQLMSGAAFPGISDFSEPGESYCFIFRCGAVPQLDWHPFGKIIKSSRTVLQNVQAVDPRLWGFSMNGLDPDRPDFPVNFQQLILEIANRTDWLSENHPGMTADDLREVTRIVAGSPHYRNLLAIDENGVPLTYAPC